MAAKFALCVLLVSMAVLSAEAWPRRGGGWRQPQHQPQNPPGSLDGAGYDVDSDPGALPEGEMPRPGGGRRGPPPHVVDRLVNRLQEFFEGRATPEGIERLLQRLSGLRPDSVPGADGRPERPGPGDRPERPGPGGRPERPGPGDRPERPGPGDRPERPGPGGRPERPGPGGRPERPGPGGRPERPGPGGRPERPGPGGRPDMPEDGGRPERPEVPESRPEVPESHPEVPESGGPPDMPEFPETDFDDAPFFFP
ncbi:basic salivary proline-rich protein 1-like [Branchiostoma lanceolatum]|uniref:basic salivary proline-rich protein 1-like n=1 Tax=Branchiostoma lanceolatum TaxID=7740 RepID=UPI003451BE3B